MEYPGWNVIYKIMKRREFNYATFREIAKKMIIKTNRSEVVHWPRRVFATSARARVAFHPFLSCKFLRYFSTTQPAFTVHSLYFGAN